MPCVEIGHEAKVVQTLMHMRIYTLCAVAAEDDELTDGDAMKTWM